MKTKDVTKCTKGGTAWVDMSERSGVHTTLLSPKIKWRFAYFFESSIHHKTNWNFSINSKKNFDVAFHRISNTKGIIPNQRADRCSQC